MNGNWDQLYAAGGIVALALGILLFIALILWILLPFAVFGIKGRLDLLIAHMRKANELLQAMNSKIDKGAGPPTG